MGILMKLMKRSEFKEVKELCNKGKFDEAFEVIMVMDKNKLLNKVLKVAGRISSDDYISKANFKHYLK